MATNDPTSVTSASELLARVAAGERDFRRANLSGANLIWANLSGADLGGANLSGADLIWANLSRANLSGADLEPIKQDVLALCRLMPAEVPGLLAALEAGRVDGSVYEGACACLVGTLANCRGVAYRNLPALVAELEIDPDSLRERWFLAIRQGDTPENSPIVAITAEWLRELVAEIGANGTNRAPEVTA